VKYADEVWWGRLGDALLRRQWLLCPERAGGFVGGYDGAATVLGTS
jgi:hypothetical protein